MIDLIKGLFDFIMHIDVHLTEIVSQYHAWVYGIVFLIVFIETGVVIMPFLPGDSLLFASGALASLGALNLWVSLLVFFVAAVLGDSLNYEHLLTKAPQETVNLKILTLSNHYFRLNRLCSRICEFTCHKCIINTIKQSIVWTS